MQTIWKFPSIGNVLAVLAISTSLLTGCFEEDEKKTKQPQSQNESVSELIEQVASIEAPVAPQNPLEQQDWTSDFLKPGDEVKILLDRNGSELSVKAKLGTRPKSKK